MDLLLFFAVGFTVGLSGAMLPGPLLIFNINQVLKGNLKAGVEVVIGHILVEFVVIVLVLIGLKQVLNSKLAIMIFSIGGGLALISFGSYVFYTAKNLRLPKEGRLNFTHGAILGGAFFSVFNPGFPIWWAAIGAPLLLNAFRVGLLAVVVFTIGHWLSDLGWYLAVSMAVHKGKRVLTDRSYQNIIKTLGIMLTGFGFYFIIYSG